MPRNAVSNIRVQSTYSNISGWEKKKCFTRLVKYLDNRDLDLIAEEEYLKAWQDEILEEEVEDEVVEVVRNHNFPVE